MNEHERGAPLECGKCRVNLLWSPLEEVYACPECEYER